ncbi:MAG: FAD-dependent oxidoreductase [Chloroflexi bacterium]|nr:FAD-dependent oxidoreductase [Chloroflexota bacterium]
MPDLSRADVVVCGAGMAGLCAGLAAAEAGAQVLVVEKGPAPGGSMKMSGGTVWTAPSMDVMLRFVPAGDRERQRRLVDGLAPGLEWLRGHGVDTGTPFGGERQVGVELDVVALTDRMVARIQAAGGEVAASTALESLERGPGGGISAVNLRDADGTAARVATSAVILATGGFGGNLALLATYVTRYADSMLRRANPWSTGDGLLAATAIGARTSPSMSTFYGHTMPAPPADPPANRWTAVTQYGSQDMILVNVRGERFMDESISLADERAPAEIAQQPDGRAFVIVDQRIYDDRPLPGRSRTEIRPNFDGAVAAGAPSVTAATLDDLADGMAAWGVSRRGLLATLTEFTEAVESGRGAELRIPRAGSPFGLVEPPFRALAVRAGITFTLGGIDVDPDQRVLDRGGRPIRGLWAAGADAGGTYRSGYMGGLVLGLVQGRAAGAAAAAFARAATTPAAS